jgi:hypothetical protein
LKLSLNNKVVFFFVLLISLCISKAANAQINTNDTIKKVSGDSLVADEQDESIEEHIKYDAEDSVVAMPLLGKAFLYGKAKVDYGSMNIQAEFIEIDYNKNLITAYGKKDSVGKNVGTPVFKDGAQTMEADKIMYNLKTKKGKIFNAWTKQGELLVYGNAIKKDSNNVIYFKNMQCILCQDADARTIFRATKAKVIPDDKIVTGPMYLEIGGVPTPLGLPFGFFPNSKKQHNGILMPTFGNSPERGFNLRQGGFYWGINDKTDMIIRGDIYANGSFALNTVNNYNVLYKASGYLNLSYSKFNIGDKDIPALFSKQTSYSVRWSHTQDNKSNPSIRFGANVNYVNNQSYNRLNSINTGQFLQNSFQSNINFTKTFKISSLSLNATHSQNAITKYVEITFPSLTFNVNRFYPFRRENAVKQNVLDKIGINYLLTAQNTMSGNDTTIFKGNLEEKMRYGVKHSIPISTNFNVFKYVTVSPALNLSSVMYTKSIQKQFVSNYGDTGRDTVLTKTNNGFVAGYDASFSTAFNTKIYFDYLFHKGKVKQIRHLLIPTLTYNYRPDYGTAQYGFWKKVQTDSIGNKANYSIFANNIYSGPEQGKQNALGINLNNTFDAKLKQKTDTGITYKKVALLQNLGISTAYNFAADSFKMSMIGITARTVIFKNININANSNFDPYAYDHTAARRMNKFVYQKGSNLARLTNASFAVSTSLSSNMIEAAKKLRQPPSVTNGAERGAVSDLNPAEKLPWNLSISYNLQLLNPESKKIQTQQTLNFSGDLMPTKYWKVGVTSGFDFIHQKISYTSFNIYRDLKCWEARIGWVPFGANKSYNFSMNLKMSMLSDFKIPRQRQWFDNIQ